MKQELIHADNGLKPTYRLVTLLQSLYLSWVSSMVEVSAIFCQQDSSDGNLKLVYHPVSALHFGKANCIVLGIRTISTIRTALQRQSIVINVELAEYVFEIKAPNDAVGMKVRTLDKLVLSIFVGWKDEPMTQRCSLMLHPHKYFNTSEDENRENERSFETVF